MLQIVEVPEQDSSLDLEENGLLVPVPGPSANSILFEERDGQGILTSTGSGFVYTENKFTLAKAPKLNIAIFITDARVAFALVGSTRAVGTGAWEAAQSWRSG